MGTDQPNRVTLAEIQEGQTATREYTISENVYQSFLRAFDDRSPIHVDAAAANRAGFAGPVMHGAILNGFVSHFVGMHFPGATAVLQSVEIRYRAPSFLGDRILIDATVTQLVESVRVMVLELEIQNQTRGELTANATVQVGLPA